MITKFDTSSIPGQAPSGSGNGMKTVLIIGALIAAGYLFYKFVYLPNQAKKNEEKPVA